MRETKRHSDTSLAPFLNVCATNARDRWFFLFAGNAEFTWTEGGHVMQTSSACNESVERLATFDRMNAMRFVIGLR